MRNYILGVTLNGSPGPNSYLSRLPLIQYLSSVPVLEFHKPVTFLVGENGTGKSTLLEAIAVASGFNPEGGSRDFNFSTHDTHSELYHYLKLIRSIPPLDGFFLRAESFYNAASYLDDSGSDMWRYGGVSFHEQSHGEAFLALVTHRFAGSGLYLLDEPEAALSPMKIMTLICAIDDLVKRNSQFIIATHSPVLMAYPNAQILQLTENGVEEKAYRETEHYKLTKQFIDAPERMIKYLLE